MRPSIARSKEENRSAAAPAIAVWIETGVYCGNGRECQTENGVAARSYRAKKLHRTRAGLTLYKLDTPLCRNTA